MALLAAGALVSVLAACSSPVAPVPSAATSSSPTVTGEASATPSVTTPSPTPLTPEQQYCADYKAITAVQDDGQGDDQEMDIAALSTWAGDTLAQYKAASQNAPKSLAARYRTVIQFLKDFKVTIDSGNEDAIIAQVRYLPTLNSSMNAIRKTSEKLCG